MNPYLILTIWIWTCAVCFIIGHVIGYRQGIRWYKKWLEDHYDDTDWLQSRIDRGDGYLPPGVYHISRPIVPRQEGLVVNRFSE